VIVVLPTSTPLTKPEEDTVAIELLDENHGLELFAVPEPES
jgi:hypothetical protein